MNLVGSTHLKYYCLGFISQRLGEVSSYYNSLGRREPTLATIQIVQLNLFRAYFAAAWPQQSSNGCLTHWYV